MQASYSFFVAYPFHENQVRRISIQGRTSQYFVSLYSEKCKFIASKKNEIIFFCDINGDSELSCIVIVYGNAVVCDWDFKASIMKLSSLLMELKWNLKCVCFEFKINTQTFVLRWLCDMENKEKHKYHELILDWEITFKFFSQV